MEEKGLQIKRKSIITIYANCNVEKWEHSTFPRRRKYYTKELKEKTTVNSRQPPNTMEYLPAVTLAERRAKVQREYLGHLVLLSDTKDVSLIDAPVKELQEFFEKNPSFISSSENISGSLLSRAYDMKAYEKIYLLLQKGANPDAIFEGSTLLHKAALQDDTFLVDILEKFGVNQNIRNHRGEIALNNAISNKSKRVKSPHHRGGRFKQHHRIR